MSRSFSLYILFAMVLGIVAGWAINTYLPAEQAGEWADGFKVVTDIFLRLIKMIIAPLVFSTLASGIAHLGSGSAIGRIGLRTMAWFLAASLVSLSLGLAAVTILQPGAGLSLPLPAADAKSGVTATALTLKDFITHVFPKSFFEAMAMNEILQIVVFSVFVGVALAALGEKVRGLVHIAEQIVEVMLKITGYVMLTAPIAVFAAIAAIISRNGLSILLVYGKFIAGFYASIGVLWIILLLAGALVLGRRIFGLIGEIRDPILLAFSTASSEAAYPRTMEALRLFGVPRRISGFVLPLGYSFNLDGSMMYCTFATIFIAQAYGIDLTWGQKLTMLALLMLTSKGMAGVPRASLVVISATRAGLKIPEAGLLLVLAIDQFLDMGRSATNVVGNAVATAVTAKWEGQLHDGPADEVAAQQPQPLPA